MVSSDQFGIQSRKATFYHQQLAADFTADNQMFLGLKNKSKEKTYEEKLYPIGKGWMWNIPYIKTVEEGTYEITGTTLKGYPFQDLTISSNSSVTVNGVRSSTALKSLEGTTHYFDADGRLIQIADPYNNTIAFHYSQHATYGKVLTKIMDVIKNYIDIAYNTEVAL